MGFMREQAPRLTRERWVDVNDLAQEIQAIWLADTPVTMDGGVVINNSTGGSALTINQGSTGDTTITINNNQPPIPPLPGLPPITNNFVTNYYGDGTVEGFPSPPPGPAKPQPGTGQTVGGGGGGGFPGRVISGTGSTYQVAVYESGLNASPTTRAVKQLQIADAISIPAGSWAVVGKVGSSYFMQVPVWL